jgi:DNA-binding NarL/FixJ family response regulator
MDDSVSVAMVSENRLFVEAVAASLSGRDDVSVVPPDRLGNGAGGVAPDVVLVDSALGRAASVGCLRRLQSLCPESKLIVLGIEREDDKLIELIEAGASGYLSKRSSPGELLEVIREVMRGEARCTPALAASAVARIVSLKDQRPPPPVIPPDELTEREREVLAQMARGLRNKEIGRDLGITAQTVKNHVHSILGKLGVERRREAVLLGYRLRLIEDGED